MPIQTTYQRTRETRRRRIAATADAIVFLAVFTTTIIATKSWLFAALCAAVITAAGWKEIRR